jgi:hypothetical protein
MVRRPNATEEGDELPPLDPSSDAAQAIALLEWARQRGFRVGPYLKVGELAFQVRDLRQTEGGVPMKDEGDIFAEHGYEEPK